MSDAIVIIPTYNEKENIKSIIEVDNGFLLAGFLEKFSGEPIDILIARTNEFGSVSGCSNDITIQSADISLVKTSRCLYLFS